jgi:hypothetical protein
VIFWIGLFAFFEVSFSEGDVHESGLGVVFFVCGEFGFESAFSVRFGVDFSDFYFLIEDFELFNVSHCLLVLLLSDLF